MNEPLKIIRPYGSGRPAPAGSICACGELALSLCGTGDGYPGVVHCLEPICQPDGHGQHCKVHRHKEGTMGYATVRNEARMEWQQFVSDGSVADAIVTFFWNLMPLSWKLRRLYEQLIRNHAPPAPLPKFIVWVKGRKFISNGVSLVEDKNAK